MYLKRFEVCQLAVSCYLVGDEREGGESSVEIALSILADIVNMRLKEGPIKLGMGKR